MADHEPCIAYSLSTDIVCKHSLLAKAPPDKAVCRDGMPQGTMMSWLYKLLCILAAIKKHLQFIRAHVPFATCFDADGMSCFREEVTKGNPIDVFYERVCYISIFCPSS